MGIQIYIKKEALENVSVPVMYHETTFKYPCNCGKTKNGLCEYCGTSSEVYTEEYAEIHGLQLAMGVTDDAVYHDANRWGSNRKVLLDFIEKHKFHAGTDWYEA